MVGKVSGRAHDELAPGVVGLLELRDDLLEREGEVSGPEHRQLRPGLRSGGTRGTEQAGAPE
jgi:hypothetical protein